MRVKPLNHNAGTMMKSIQAKRQTGVTMIEILITIIVVAVGLLGAVGLQVNSMKAGNNANFRYQATLLAYDMAERMRANPLGIKSNNYDAITVTDTGTNYTGTITAANMYKQDIYDWKQSLKSQLPSGNGTVTVDGSDNRRFTIHVEWTPVSDMQVEATGATTDSVDVVVRLYES